MYLMYKAAEIFFENHANPNREEEFDVFRYLMARDQNAKLHSLKHAQMNDLKDWGNGFFTRTLINPNHKFVTDVIKEFNKANADENTEWGKRKNSSIELIESVNNTHFSLLVSYAKGIFCHCEVRLSVSHSGELELRKTDSPYKDVEKEKIINEVIWHFGVFIIQNKILPLMEKHILEGEIVVDGVVIKQDRSDKRFTSWSDFTINSGTNKITKRAMEIFKHMSKGQHIL